MPTIEMKNDGPCRPGLGMSLLAVAVVVPALLGLGRLWDAVQGSWLASPWAVGGTLVLAAVPALVCRRFLRRWLTAVPFTVALLVSLLIATVLGTLIVQGHSPEAFAARHPNLAGLRRFAGLDDIFHSFAFGGLLALLAISLVLTVVEKRSWRLSDWPVALNHAGVLVVLVGGLLGTLTGQKGHVDIHVGNVARQFALLDHSGHPTGETLALKFGLKLDKLEVERAPLEFRFYVYRREGEAWKATGSRGLEEATEWMEAGASGQSYRLVTAFPDFELRPELVDASEGTGRPALQVQTVDREGSTKMEILLAGVEGRDEISFRDGKTRLAFAWTESQITVSTDPFPLRHMLQVRRGGTAARPAEFAVQPGGKYPVADGEELTVQEWYPDFVFDSATRTVRTKSSEPNNPALKISLRDSSGNTVESFVFAKDKGFAGPNGTPIGNVIVSYRFLPPREPADREVVFLGSSRELLDYRKGILKERMPFTGRAGTQILKGISANFERLSASAQEVETPLTRSTNWLKPVAQVMIRSGTEIQTHYLKAAMPFDLGNGREVLVFQPKPEAVETYRSHVSFVEGEKTIGQGLITVNDPLSYGGYRFYQSGFHADDPSYSGIMVVKDPGLGTVYIGFVLVCFGAVCRFCMKPRLVEGTAGGIADGREGGSLSAASSA